MGCFLSKGEQMLPPALLDPVRGEAPHTIPKGFEARPCPVTGLRSSTKPKGSAVAHDLTDVRKAIHGVMFDPSHDDGSFAPLLIRFAWHLCGTYDAESQNGGSNGATMRFDAEANDPENAGLNKAKALLAPIHARYPWLSLADLWILAGYVAIECAGGPCIRFAHGRRDFTKEEAVAIYGRSGCPFGDGKFNPSGSRLPAADLGSNDTGALGALPCQREAPTINAMRSTFKRMGIDDRETVALILLGHQFCRCHREVSGYEGPWWARDPTTWNSDGMGFLYCADQYDWEYEDNLCANARPMNPSKWPRLAPAQRLQGLCWTEAIRPHPALAPGKRQYDNTGNGRHIMMLVSDMCLTWDPTYRQHLKRYRNDRKAFRLDAIAAWKKLTELGCDGLLVEEATPLEM
jgi:catalase (peroxidase I)